jgi:hypothetical protein
VAGEHVLRLDLLRGLADLPERIPARNVFSAMSIFESKWLVRLPKRAQASSNVRSTRHVELSERFLGAHHNGVNIGRLRSPKKTKGLS